MIKKMIWAFQWQKQAHLEDIHWQVVDPKDYIEERFCGLPLHCSRSILNQFKKLSTTIIPYTQNDRNIESRWRNPEFYLEEFIPAPLIVMDGDGDGFLEPIRKAMRSLVRNLPGAVTNRNSLTQWQACSRYSFSTLHSLLADTEFKTNDTQIIALKSYLQHH